MPIFSKENIKQKDGIYENERQKAMPQVALESRA